MVSSFKKAERKQTKLKIAITGPSGSGKTLSSLLLAKGMGKKIALIDTENKSASLYADRFEFDALDLDPPYTIDKYIQGIKLAQALKYDVVIIDSISHAWAGEGGLLAKKEALDSRGGNSFTNWATISKEQEHFKAMLLNANLHVICTMRSKQDYVVEENEKGKKVPKKVGLAPVQRDGIEYEFTTVFDLDKDHNACVSKDRTSLFDGKIFKITSETGDHLMKWLNEAKPETPETDQAPAATAAPVAAVASIAPVATQSTGAFCESCRAEIVLHESKLGYVCPNSKNKGDGHTRVLVQRLDEFRNKQQSKVIEEVH